MKKLFIVALLCFNTFVISKAQGIIILEGNYQGKNLYVQNPYGNSAGVGFCVTDGSPCCGNPSLILESGIKGSPLLDESMEITLSFFGCKWDSEISITLISRTGIFSIFSFESLRIEVLLEVESEDLPAGTEQIFPTGDQGYVDSFFFVTKSSILSIHPEVVNILFAQASALFFCNLSIFSFIVFSIF